MRKISTLVKKSSALLMLLAFAVGSFGSAFTAKAAVAPNWDTTGDYVLTMNYNEADYSHDMSLAQDDDGNITGDGGSPAGANTYMWTISSGTIEGDAIDFWANYTATSDAVTPQTVMHVMGVVAPNGTMSGTWTDNYQGGDRGGTFSTTDGEATAIPSEPLDNENITTKPATAITMTDATLNGKNEDNAAMGHSFWASDAPFSTASPTLPANVYSTNDLGAIAMNTPFSALLSSVNGMPAITPNNTYYFAAWSNVDGTWYPGEVLNFTTTSDNDGTIGGVVEGGPGVLEVTSIETTDGNATADGTFTNGWKYTFNITVPSDETDLSMKFADWVKNPAPGTIPVANNMRISSPQADNGGATVLLTAANTYSSPTLNMITDLDPSMDGIQVKVLVEVKIPVGSSNGAYTTTYGVNTN